MFAHGRHRNREQESREEDPDNRLLNCMRDQVKRESVHPSSSPDPAVWKSEAREWGREREREFRMICKTARVHVHRICE